MLSYALIGFTDTWLHPVGKQNIAWFAAKGPVDI